jgi:hypothetical protein
MERIIYILLLVLFLFQIPSAHSQPLHLEIYLNISINDIANLLNITIVSGPEASIFYPDGNYTFQVLSKNGEILYQKNFEAGFVILSHPPVFVNETIVMFSIPYLPNMQILRLLKGGKVIFEENIGKYFCNQNGKCEGQENFYSCPKDCPSGSKDNVCDALIDGKCDPDCKENVDLDCNLELKRKILGKVEVLKPTELRKDERKEISIFMIVIIVAIIFVTVLIFLLRSRKTATPILQLQT